MKKGLSSHYFQIKYKVLLRYISFIQKGQFLLDIILYIYVFDVFLAQKNKNGSY